MEIKTSLKKFWKFLKADTWQSWLVSLVLLIILIRFIFFPLLSLATGTSLPLVIVESCSMYHSSDFDTFWATQGAWYEARGINKSDFEKFPMKNGINKGDIILVLGKSTPKIGDIIIFNGGSQYPLIHRVVSESPLQTKGDNNPDQIRNANGVDETNIQRNNVLGEAKIKVIPLLGWIKLIWFEPFKPASERGLCH